MKNKNKNKNNNKVIILIPALDPDEQLLTYVNELKKRGLTDILIVDDGSSQAYQTIFHNLSTNKCLVLRHLENRGKGSALKTGFNYIQENYKEFACVVTVDSDGQHAVEDVVRISQLSKQSPGALTLGVRDFSKPGIPVKSLMGNKFASFLFAGLYGKRLPDTQTGLRAFGMPLLAFMSNIRGNRFEYEIQVLIACIQSNVPMQMLPIQVIYENANMGTHFRPCRDSVKIIATMFSNFGRFLIASIIGAGVDLGIAWILLDLFRPFLKLEYLRILAATTIARVISTGVNYFLNKMYVFKKGKEDNKSLTRYLLLAAMIIFLSTTGVYALGRAFGVNEKIGKIICDTLLFLFSYRMQQMWVFKRKGDNHYE